MVDNADEIAIVISRKVGGTMSEVMLGALSFVEDWCNRKRLLNIPEKSTFVPLTRKKNLNVFRDIFF